MTVPNSFVTPPAPPLPSAPPDLRPIPTDDEASRLRRTGARRVVSALAFSAGLAIFFLTLPADSREGLIQSAAANSGLIALLLGFGVVALSLLWAGGQRLDVWLFKLVNVESDPSPLLDRLMWIATQIGNVGFAIAISVLAYLAGERRFAVMFTLGSLTLLLLVTILKAFTDRARPYKTLREARLVGWKELGLSFPSGHTTQSFFMAGLIIRHFELALPFAILLYGIAGFVGVTRVYLGVHYPRDVIAGGLLGVVWSIVIILVAPYY